ncbi:ABC transporter substrate-binding protein [Actinomadura sp. 7K507]|uniref:ABC transporter substrate-binding protein n=1 Tax=Actinomadura sp. 7K507 TaxID=2530365 RepID=UPI001053BF7A|nr:ABC transporter substrate-binding protein [Actinomadura sp. 7K507]TDC92994.1 ABC transporter substrate-binding protein [Actinomadura sp. 7K507]
MLTLVACGGDGTDEAEPQPGGSLTFAVSADAPGFDPVSDGASFSGQTFTMVRTIIEPIVALDENSDWRPFLAESVEPDKDATEWTIKVREGITFSNGDPLDAEVVVANLDAHIESPVNAATLSAVESVKAADAMTVVVRLSEPWATFPYYLTGTPGLVVPLSSLDNPEKASDAPIGTGPFLFDGHRQGSSMKVKKNPGYWRADKGLPHLDEIEFRIVPDGPQRTLALQANDVDGMSTRDPQDVVKFDDPAYTTTRVKGMAVTEGLFFLNTANKKLADAGLRRALARATDQKAFVDTLRGGLTRPATGPWAKDTPWYTETDYPTYDLDAAKKAVSEYEAKNGPVELSLMTLADPSAAQSGQLLQDMWSKAGVDLKLDQTDQATLVERLITGDYDLSGAYEFGAADPDMDRLLLHSSGVTPLGEISTAITRLKDPELDTALDAGRATTDKEERVKAYATVQERLAELVPIIWLDHANASGIITSSKVHGVGEGVLPTGQKEAGPFGSPSPSLSFADVWIEN